MASRFSSNFAPGAQRTWSFACSCSSRSSATQHSTREWVWWARPVRGSQMPSSGSSQCRQTYSPQARSTRWVSRSRLPPACDEVGHGVDHLAVDVELKLLRGQVADPDRPRSAVSSQVIQRALGGRLVAVDVVEHPQLGPGQAGGVQQPVDEGVGLVHATQTDQRAHRERGVAQPAEAIVPVERPADPLGQRGGRRGDHGTRGSEDHELEGQRAANHRLAAGAVVARRWRPSSATSAPCARARRATTHPAAAAPPAPRPRR